jgi:hypothetical protein
MLTRQLSGTELLYQSQTEWKSENHDQPDTEANVSRNETTGTANTD